MSIPVKKSHAASLCLLLLCFPAAGETPADFCAYAQGIIAGTTLLPQVQMHRSRETFIESRALDQPFTVQQFSGAPSASNPALPTVVSCKMRTAERVGSTHPGETTVAGTERNCDAVHRDMLDQALARIPVERQAVAADHWVVEEEELAFTGPGWLEPWPFVPVTEDREGRMRLHTKALYVPYAWWIPMPRALLGNHYCHLISPGYLEALIRGELRPRQP